MKSASVGLVWHQPNIVQTSFSASIDVLNKTEFTLDMRWDVKTLTSQNFISGANEVQTLTFHSTSSTLDQTHLLPVGPFASLTPSLVASLGDSVNSTVNPLSGNSRFAPFKVKNCTITDSGGLFADLTNINGQGSTSQMSIWCDVFTMTGNASLRSNGEDGESGGTDGTAYYGGNGGGGYSGGAGGSASVSGNYTDGSPGGNNGAAGTPGGSDGDPNSVPGGGGIGNSLAADAYDYGTGGNGGDGAFGGGSGGNRGGGGGDSVPVDTGPGASGGSGGGAGLISIVSRIFQSNVFGGNTPSITAIGGEGGGGLDGGEQGLEGGGGVIDWYCMKKAGTISVNVFGANYGSIRFWEVFQDGHTVLHTNPADVWDHT